MLTYDQMWGSRPRRIHNLGKMPWNEASKVPSLSMWFHDMRPFYSCCYWQEEQAVGCETYRFERRPSQDCVAYQAPGIAGVFGDPHLITFDGSAYTFNGLGEFVLARSTDQSERFEVQGRFEQLPPNYYGQVMATQLTAVAMRGNTTTTIEVRLRPLHARWRYRLDVLADGRKVYFDRESLKFQHFDGVTVYTPTYLLNQSQVVVQFDAGIGVEVVENEGYMTGRVFLPWKFIVSWQRNSISSFLTHHSSICRIKPLVSLAIGASIRWMISPCPMARWRPSISTICAVCTTTLASSGCSPIAMCPMWARRCSHVNLDAWPATIRMPHSSRTLSWIQPTSCPPIVAMIWNVPRSCAASVHSVNMIMRWHWIEIWRTSRRTTTTVWSTCRRRMHSE